MKKYLTLLVALITGATMWATSFSITLTGYNAEYDGQEHSIEVADTITGDVISYSIDSTTWQETKPSFKNVVADTVIYVRVQREGYQDWGGCDTVTITPCMNAIVITAGSSTQLYNGDSLFNASYTTTGNLMATDTLASVIIKDTIINVGTVANKVLDYRIENKEGDNVTNCYGNITTVDGHLTIIPLPLVFTSFDSTRMYNGETLKYDSLKMVGTFARNEGASVQVTGSITDAGSVVNTIEIIWNQGTNESNYYVVKVEGRLTVNPRQIIVTTGSASKPFDGESLQCKDVTISGDGFVGTDTIEIEVVGAQRIVGSNDNSFYYKLSNGANEKNYTIITNEGILTVYNSIFPEIVGMYDKWNIVLNVNALENALAKVGITATIEPENVHWYTVVNDPDEVDIATGMVDDDAPAMPYTGLFHTEEKAMSGQYYAVVFVPVAKGLMGISIFQSNVVFVETPAPTVPTRKQVVNGQLIIIRDGVEYNALGGKL